MMKSLRVFAGAGLQRGQIGAGARFGIALAPDDLAAQGRRDEFALLLLGAEFQQGRHQHGDALIGERAGRAGAGEFLGNDARFQNVRLGAIAAIFPRNGARGIAMLDQKPLPGQRFGIGPAFAIALREFCAIGFEKAAHLAAKLLVFGAIGEIHGAHSLCWRAEDSRRSGGFQH